MSRWTLDLVSCAAKGAGTVNRVIPPDVLLQEHELSCGDWPGSDLGAGGRHEHLLAAAESGVGVADRITAMASVRSWQPKTWSMESRVWLDRGPGNATFNGR